MFLTVRLLSPPFSYFFNIKFSIFQSKTVKYVNNNLWVKKCFEHVKVRIPTQHQLGISKMVQNLIETIKLIPFLLSV